MSNYAWTFSLSELSNNTANSSFGGKSGDREDRREAKRVILLELPPKGRKYQE